MRLDHIAYRVADRHKTKDFFVKTFGYKVQTEFDLEFDDGSKVSCYALEPPEKLDVRMPWTFGVQVVENRGPTVEGLLPQAEGRNQIDVYPTCNYHLAPEIFVSSGEPDSIVGKWVAERGGVGGIHHLAYQVESVADTMREWREKGYAEFTTDEPLTCPDLVQCFTKPSELTGVIYEFIERGAHGFCADNVKNLMLSTADQR